MLKVSPGGEAEFPEASEEPSSFNGLRCTTISLLEEQAMTTFFFLFCLKVSHFSIKRAQSEHVCFQMHPSNEVSHKIKIVPFYGTVTFFKNTLIPLFLQHCSIM